MSDSSQSVRRLFDEKAKRWTQGYEPGGPLAARGRLFVDEIVSTAPPPGRVLDFGCGTGHIANALSDAGYTVEGLDMSPAMLAEGERLFGGKVKLTVLPAAWTTLPCPDSHFDAAMASSVLEYVEDPASVLGELARVLRPGGLLVLTVPNMRHPRRWLEQIFQGGLRSRLISSIADRLPRIHLYASFLRTSRSRFSEHGWRALFEAAGFIVRRTRVASSPMLTLFALERQRP